METTSLRLFLQSLCQNSPWNYAVFWKLQHRPHMLLTWEDGYYDARRPRACMTNITDDAYSKSSQEFLASNCELSTCIESLDGLSIGAAMAEMSTAYYAIGEGVIGEAAYIGVPCWVFSNNITNDGFNSHLVSQCADEWLPQFAAGVETILLIPSMPEGVLQLGSFETVTEDAQLVADIKDKFASNCRLAECPSSFWLSVEVQHQSLVMMPAVAEILDESSTNMRSNIGGNPRVVDNFRTKEDQMSHANKTLHMIPVPCHIFERDMAKIQEFENGFKEDLHLMNVVDAIAPLSHQLLEHNISDLTRSEIDRSLNLHEMGVLSSSNHYNAKVSRDYVNEMIDFYLNRGVMEPPPLSIDCDSMISETADEFLSFPRDCELHKALGPDIMDCNIQYMLGSSDLANSSVYSGNFYHHVEPLSWDSDGFSLQGDDKDNLLQAVITNASSISDYSSPSLSINASSVQFPKGRFSSDSKGPSQSGRSGTVGEDAGPWNCVTSAAGYGSTLTNNAPSTTTCGNTARTLLIDQPQEKGYDFLHHRKKLNQSTTHKRRARPGDSQKLRPRDRQLIQDRIKELRQLVPDGAKCSIDGLLNKAIKHMGFLQSITDRADKLRQQAVKKVSERARPKLCKVEDNGMNWALDLVDEKQMCPIVVKDLKSPGQMLIEMVCDNYGRFLDIADVIHRLELTILKGVMEKRSEGTWAYFVVEATGSFHRLDLFWPLMQLLQQKQVPISNKI